MKANSDETNRKFWLTAAMGVALLVLVATPRTATAQWLTNGNNISNTNTGNVGVGTATPSSRLDVSGRIQQSGSATDAGYLLTNRDLLSSKTALNPGIAFFGGNGTNALYGADLGHNSVTDRYRTRLFSGNILADVAIGRQTNAQTNPTQSAFTEYLTIRGDTGFVGVGTATPTQTLDVSGQIVSTGSQTLTTANKGVMEVTNTITNNATAVAGFRARNIFNGNGNIPEGLDVVPTFAPSANISITYAGLIGAFYAPPAGVTITDAVSGNFVNAYSNTSGAVTNGTTLQVDSPIIFGSLKPANQYGLRIKNQGTAGMVTNYGLYVDSQSGATNNYAAIFAGGNVGIGTANPANRLTVASTVAGDGLLVSNSAAGSGAVVDLVSTDTGGVAWRAQSLGNVANRVGNFSIVQVGNNTAIEIQKTTLNVGIGTVNPASRLEVVGEIRSTLTGSVGGFRFPDGSLQTKAATVTSLIAGAGLTDSVNNGEATLNIVAGTGVTVAADSISVNYGSGAGTAVEGNKTITASGDGISGGAPLTLGAGGALTVNNTDKGSTQPIFKNIATDTTQFSAGSNTDTLRFAGSGGTTVTLDTTNKKVTIDATGSTGSAANIAAGTFGQNTGGGNYTFPGNVTVNGNIAAKYQDMAEWVPSSEQLAAGTVVVLDSTKSNQVISSSQPYDTRVAGVISEQPGIALGESGAGKVLVATTGRVLVQVDASKSPIHIGDLLVTSDVPGVAMKSEPVNVGGVKLHRPGTLIGKALEPLEKGKGKILVLLSLQ